MVDQTRKTVKVTRSNSGKPANPAASSDDKAAFNAGLQVLSTLISRAQLASRAGLQFGGARDLYEVFGYKKVLDDDSFLVKYQRQDVASRVIDAPPGATWSNPPTIENEAINEALYTLDEEVKLWNAMYRADRLSRLGAYSILFYGFDDTGNVERPVNPERVSELLYVKPISKRMVQTIDFVKDPRSRRFGMPEKYKIMMEDPTTKSSGTGSTSTASMKELTIDASRVIHIVENPLEDSTYGTPIIEKCFNLLDDLLKVAGGTAETYWLTGNRGIHANVDKEMEINPEDAAALSDEMDEYMHQLRRVLRTRGVDVKPLESKTPNPKETFEMIAALISGTTGIPKRILMGSEAGQLASEQDRANWAERIAERRELFVNPIMLRPSLVLLQNVGLLPEGDIKIQWPSAFIQNPLEEGQTMAQTARAIGNISRQTGSQTPMQLTTREEARAILGLEGDLPESEIIKPEEEEEEEAPPNLSVVPTEEEEEEEESTQRREEA